MTTIYTRVSYEWDGVAERYVVREKQGFEYDGPIVFAKGGGGILGAVVMVVAAVFAPYALPAIAEAMSVSSVVAGAIYGGGVGMLSSAISGGNILQGGLMGALGGAAGGALMGGAETGGAFGPTPDGGNIMTSAGPTVAPSATADVAAQASNAGGANLSGGFDVDGFSTITDASMPQGATAQTQSPTLDVNAPSAAPQAGLDTSVVGQQPSQYSDWMSNPGQSGGVSPEEALRGEAAGSPKMTAPGGVFDGFNFQKAGLELGKAALGNVLGPKTPDMSTYNSYLGSLTDANKRAMDFNMDMANKKAAIGTQLSADANAMSPDYYAQQQQTAQKNRDASLWADTEQRMRAAGYGDAQIQAEKNRMGIVSSQNQGTAYDAGWQTGMNSRNNTYGTAGSMFGQVSAPTDTVGNSYTNLYTTARQGQDNAGATIQKVYDAGMGNANTGVKKTNSNAQQAGLDTIG